MITVRLPSTFRVGASDTLEVSEPVGTIADLIEVLDRRLPGFRDQLEDSVFNFAVNDEMLLFRARDRALQPGDVVEVIPTISGGSGAAISHEIRRSGASNRRQKRSGEQQYFLVASFVSCLTF